MSRSLLAAIGAAVLLLMVLVVRPRGDRLLEAVSGGTDVGAFLVGLLMWVVPLGFALAYSLPVLRARRAGVAEDRLPRRRWVGVAFWVTGLPLAAVPFIGSRRAADTPFEQGELFEPWLTGFGLGIGVLAVGLVVLSRTARRTGP